MEENLSIDDDRTAWDAAWRNRPLRPQHWQNVIKRHFKKVLKEAGLPADFRFYSLRHTSATQDLKDGVSPKIVSARLGHNSIELTLDTYVDYQSDMQNEAAEHQQKRYYG